MRLSNIQQSAKRMTGEEKILTKSYSFCDYCQNNLKLGKESPCNECDARLLNDVLHFEFDGIFINPEDAPYHDRDMDNKPENWFVVTGWCDYELK